MKKVVLMALALGLSLPAMASEKVIDMYKSEKLWLLFPVGQGDGKRRV
ncbi:Exported protein [Escherichia coli]|nr:Exported protein [Escherichia coli]